MGGVGSGNWYRFDKKATTGECHSLDVRYLHREGLLTPGRWFSLRWSRTDRETDSIGGVVEGTQTPERGATSCAGTATTSPTKVSGITGCTGLYTEPRRSESSWVAARI